MGGVNTVGDRMDRVDRVPKQDRSRATRQRLLEAADRNLWEHPEQATLDALRQVYLETEGDLEDN